MPCATAVVADLTTRSRYEPSGFCSARLNVEPFVSRALPTFDQVVPESSCNATLPRALGTTVPVTTIGLPAVTMGATLAVTANELATMCSRTLLLAKAFELRDFARTARTVQVACFLGPAIEKRSSPADVGLACASPCHFLATSRSSATDPPDAGVAVPVSTMAVRTLKLAAIGCRVSWPPRAAAWATAPGRRLTTKASAANSADLRVDVI